ncbi:MAG: peptide-methionine (S)-S-oxide reductase MsrA [Nitrospirae bacterium]|nr:peptide-methionine (S)-S-oxide reductase MsrA [Nitrospirota bacterium]
MESDFEKLPGVVSVESGYTGGHVIRPGYKQVSGGGTGHYEAVRILYDPAKLSFAQILDHFWMNIDPTNASGQFCDHGDQYRSAIFYLNDTQQSVAEGSKHKLESVKPFNGPVVTEILPAGIFYPAEDYHQDYYKKNPIRYRYYRSGCGRDRRLQEVWGAQAGGH